MAHKKQQKAREMLALWEQEQAGASEVGVEMVPADAA
jgi:hypothetical protein